MFHGIYPSKQQFGASYMHSRKQQENYTMVCVNLCKPNYRRPTAGQNHEHIRDEALFL